MNFLKKLLIALGAVFAILVLGVVALVLFYPGLHSSSLEMALNVITGKGSNRPQEELLARLEAEDGFQVSIFARDLPHPRMLARDAAGRLLVSNPRAGEVILLEDSSGDGAADKRNSLLTGLNRPHGLALHEGFLYVAESNQVGRIPYADGSTRGNYEVIAGGFTDNGNHWTKSIAFGPEGYLYVAMGSTCNVCVEEDERRATIMRFKADGSEGRIFASGLRNSVGLNFAWDGALYATDNGRDLLGDDYPPCELNRIVDGGFYGWPYLNGDNDKDPDFGYQRPDLQAKAIAPVHHFPPHNAPLGIHFVHREPSALVALHGSWNRSTPDGYKVVRLTWRGSEISSGDFLWGFEKDGDIVGRPVDIVGDGQGGFFVSDDYAKVIYRVSRNSDFGSARIVSTAEVERFDIDPLMADAGSALYKQNNCDSCHGDSAPTPVPLDGLQGKYSTESLADYFLTPTPPMPTYPLNDGERLQLAHYLLDRDQAF